MLFPTDEILMLATADMPAQDNREICSEVVEALHSEDVVLFSLLATIGYRENGGDNE